MIEQQELWCHACSRYVQFEMDMEVNGNYVLDCPNCEHSHYRVLRDGVITDTRWNGVGGTFMPLNNMPVINIGATSYSTTSITTTDSGATTVHSTYTTGTSAYSTGNGW